MSIEQQISHLQNQSKLSEQKGIRRKRHKQRKKTTNGSVISTLIQLKILE